MGQTPSEKADEAELLLERCLVGFLFIGLIHLLLRAGAVLTTALESAPKIIGPLVLPHDDPPGRLNDPRHGCCSRMAAVRHMLFS